MTILTQTQTQLLCERLAAWDVIDEAIENGHLALAANLTQQVTKDLTPKIREGYGL